MSSNARQLGELATQGDNLVITWNPSNYTPDDSPPESQSPDDITAHLKGIDTALTSVVGTHASTHITGAGDEIDGDQLDIDFTPANYTPTTSPPEASSLDHLTAHLKGIDNALIVVSSHASTHILGGGDQIDGDQLDIDFTPSNYTPSTTPPEASSVDHLTAHLYGIDVLVGDHDSRHISAGADEIDGDKLDIDWNPTNYTPDVSPSEVTSVDELTAHLKGIDTALASAGGAAPGKNIIINGNFDVWQRGTNIVSPVNAYTADRWEWVESGGGSVQVFRDQSTVVTGSNNSLRIINTGSDPSIASTDRYTLEYKVEGYDAQHLAFGTASAEEITLSFWVRSTLTGTYSVGFQNENSNRTYATTYSVSVANTWEQKTITLTGDTTGTWDTENGIGLRIIFTLAAGSNFTTGVPNAWAANGNFASTSQVNWQGSGTNFYLAQVQLEVGDTATTFERRHISRERALCYRYYLKLPTDVGTSTIDHAIAAGQVRATTTGHFALHLPTTMRTTPTVVENQLRVRSGGSSRDITSIGLIGSAESNTLLVTAGWSTSLTQGYGLVMMLDQTTGYLELDAEL